MAGPGTATAPIRIAVPRSGALLTALAVLAAVVVLTGTVTAAPASATSVATVEGTFTAKLYQARTSHGIPRPTTGRHLVAVARAWAASMANRSTLSHNPNLTSRVSNWRWLGENVGYGPDAVSVHIAFMSSPGHRANVLDRDTPRSASAPSCATGGSGPLRCFAARSV